VWDEKFTETFSKGYGMNGVATNRCNINSEEDMTNRYKATNNSKVHICCGSGLQYSLEFWKVFRLFKSNQKAYVLYPKM